MTPTPTGNRIFDRWMGSPYAIGLLLMIHGLIWGLVAFSQDVHPDMADHWVWSRWPEWGYFEHPPMVALTMKLATLIGGDNPATLKLGSILFSIFILYIAYRLGLLLFDKSTALAYAVILEGTLYFSAGSVFWHIDQPYMVFWLLALITLVKLIQTQNLNWMIALGVILGLGAESKYIMAFLPVGLVVFIIWDKNWRHLLWAPQTYLGGLLCLIILAPNLYWNQTHDWVTFTYNFNKGMTGAKFGIHFIIFTLSHLALFSLVFSLLFWRRLLSGRMGPVPLKMTEGTPASLYRLLMATGMVPMVIFTLTSFRGRGTDPHWVNVAYFSFFLLLARFLVLRRREGQRKNFGRLLVFGMLWNLLFAGALNWQLQFNPLNHDYPETRLAKVLGWEDTAQQIEEVLKNNKLYLPTYVISREYHLSGALSLYLPNHPWPYSIEKPIRNQWSPVEAVSKAGALVVCPPDECAEFLVETRNRFVAACPVGECREPTLQEPEPTREMTFLGQIETFHRNFVVRRLRLYLLPPKT